MSRAKTILGRRRVPRRSFENPVGVLYRGKYVVEKAFQVGEGGMMISCSQEMKVSDSLVVNFFLQSHVTVIVRGIVRNVLQAEGDLPARYGIEFQNLEFNSKREIRNFVASATLNEGSV
jgi:hypothetical protein